VRKINYHALMICGIALALLLVTAENKMLFASNPAAENVLLAENATESENLRKGMDILPGDEAAQQDRQYRPESADQDRRRERDRDDYRDRDRDDDRDGDRDRYGRDDRRDGKHNGKYDGKRDGKHKGQYNGNGDQKGSNNSGRQSLQHNTSVLFAQNETLNEELRVDEEVNMGRALDADTAWDRDSQVQKNAPTLDKDIMENRERRDAPLQAAPDTQKGQSTDPDPINDTDADKGGNTIRSE
jgi:hypothetical protein